MKRIVETIVDVKPDEMRALWLGFVFNFVVLGGYYVIRPIRDNIGSRLRKSLMDGHRHADCHADRELIGGGFWSDVTHVAKSPYPLGICSFMPLHTITSTLVYFQQADITEHADLVQICGGQR